MPANAPLYKRAMGRDCGRPTSLRNIFNGGKFTCHTNTIFPEILLECFEKLGRHGGKRPAVLVVLAESGRQLP